MTYESAPQIADAGRMAAWSQHEVALDTDEDRAEVLYRVTVLVEWYDQATTPLGREAIPARTYRTGADEFLRASGCPVPQT